MLPASPLVDAVVRNWAIVAFVLTTATLIIVPTLVLLKYVRISLNIMRSTKPPLARNPLDFNPLSGEIVTFPAFDGLPLNGMIVRPPDDVERRGTVVFAHEYCSDMQSCARYCRPLLEVGYEIFTFDFRGHGQSACPDNYTPRQWVTDREIDDMRGAVGFVQSWLEERGLPRTIGAFGISRGAGAAILAAHENRAIRAIVSDGGFSTDTTIESLMKRWAYIFAKVRVVYENHPPAFWRFLRWLMISAARQEFRCRFPSVRKAVQRMEPCAMFFIHGERDSYLPVEQSRKLYALAGQPKYLWIAPGARHNQAVILHPGQYAQMTIRFFDEHLAGLPARPTASFTNAEAAPLNVDTVQPAAFQPGAARMAATNGANATPASYR